MVFLSYCLDSDPFTSSALRYRHSPNITSKHLKVFRNSTKKLRSLLSSSLVAAFHSLLKFTSGSWPCLPWFVDYLKTFFTDLLNIFWPPYLTRQSLGFFRSRNSASHITFPIPSCFLPTLLLKLLLVTECASMFSTSGKPNCARRQPSSPHWGSLNLSSCPSLNLTHCGQPVEATGTRSTRHAFRLSTCQEDFALKNSFHTLAMETSPSASFTLRVKRLLETLPTIWSTAPPLPTGVSVYSITGTASAAPAVCVIRY